jgi:hypothetical protein
MQAPAKRRHGPYRSGTRIDWIKVKRQSWQEANKKRWGLFEDRVPPLQ